MQEATASLAAATEISLDTEVALSELDVHFYIYANHTQDLDETLKRFFKHWCLTTQICQQVIKF